jgi:glycosyltransferase involved in cell wall biosynthesis
MRILVLSWRDIHSPRAGGAERVTYEHMRRWVLAGHEVTLFTACYPGAMAEETLSGIRIVRRATEKTVHLAAQHWFRRLGQKPDILVDEIHGVPFGSLPVIYAGIPRIAWIFEVLRDVWFSMYPLPVAVAGLFLEKATLRWYGHCQIPFVTDSDSAATDLAACGIPARNITVVAPAIGRSPLAELPAKEEYPTLIVLGRVVRSKRVEDALHALANVHEQIPECRLWVVGVGASDYEAELRQLAGQLGIAHAVEFLGRVNEDEKYRRLARAHLLVHPSQREGWGINVIEANAMGTPAVGYRVPGLRDSIVHQETGILSPVRRPTLMARSICVLLSRAEQYRAMQLRALDWSRQFTWDAAASRSLEILTRVHGSSCGDPDDTPQYLDPDLRRRRSHFGGGTRSLRSAMVAATAFIETLRLMLSQETISR